MLPMVLMWGPHCVCKSGFSRLPNGTCVALEDAACVELYRPSAGSYGVINYVIFF